MVRYIKKGLRDLLINPANGRLSMKRSASFICLLMFLVGNLVAFIDMNISGGFDMRLRIPPIELMTLDLLGAMGQQSLTIAGHYFARKTKDGNGQPLEPAYNDIPPPLTTKPPLE